MKTLPLEASDEEILEAVRQWVGLLIEERYKEACDLMVNPAHNLWHWSPQFLEETIRSYGFSPDKPEIYRVTSLEEATGDHEPSHNVHRYYEGGLEGYVWFDLPLNGEWSDLTAIITFRPINGKLALELESIEVM